jgi:hypothetical protein
LTAQLAAVGQAEGVIPPASRRLSDLEFRAKIGAVRETNFQNMALSLTRADVEEYSRKNQYAMMMFMGAGSDYIASRCCILNTLFAGFRLASEAVEKILKAHIFLVTGEKTKLRGNDRHNPYLLKQELNTVRQDRRLDTFDALLLKLYDHYQSRYFDNRVTGKGASGDELIQIDELFIYLVETLPVSDEVKYRTAFIAHLCEANDRQVWRNHYWAVERNQTLQPKIPQIERTYREVFEHLYPKTLSA